MKLNNMGKLKSEQIKIRYWSFFFFLFINHLGILLLHARRVIALRLFVVCDLLLLFILLGLFRFSVFLFNVIFMSSKIRLNLVGLYLISQEGFAQLLIRERFLFIEGDKSSNVLVRGHRY